MKISVFDDLRRLYITHIELNQDMKGGEYKGTEYETHEWTSGQSGPFIEDGFMILVSKSSRHFDKDKNYLSQYVVNRLC